MNKSHLFTLGFALATLVLGGQEMSAQKTNFSFTEASELTLIGKLFPDTPNPYHRIDTVKYKGFTTGENQQVRETSGVAVVFRTDSPTISVKSSFVMASSPANTMHIASRGYDLYIKKDGRWLWAGSGCAPQGRDNNYNCVLVDNMDKSEKECMLYLPLYSEEKSIQIGVAEGSHISKGETPFRHRVGIFGSSFTHGASCSRSGMTYPAQFSRNTGIQLLSIACDGNCKLQPYFATAIAEADFEAFIFDAFSNPSPNMIKERLFPFIETIQKSHPGKPLIFQRTIYRERRNFDTATDRNESAKMAMADSLMKIACTKYSDVYYVECTNATDKNHDSSVDGTHPGDNGYTLWAESIEKPILKILRKYGIR